MSDEKKTEELREAKAELNTDPTSQHVTAGQSRLSAAKQLVEQANKDAETRIFEREQSIRNTELENEKRLADTRARIAETAARAEMLENERAARMEYSGEYRQRLMARENRRAAEEKKRRQEAEIEAARVKEEERAKEIEEFVKKEREAASNRAALSADLFYVASNSASENADVDPEAAEARVVEKNIEDQPVEENRKATEASTTASEDEKIVLEINPGIAVHNIDDGDDNVIRIGGMYYQAQKPNNTAQRYTPAPSLAFDFDSALANANERHTALRLAAVAKAAGVYKDEIRLLEEEELRYNREISELQAKRMEYAERREYMSATAESLEAHGNGGIYGLTEDSSQSFGELPGSRITGEQLYAESELLQYEKSYGVLKSYEERFVVERFAEKSEGELMSSEEEVAYHSSATSKFAKSALQEKLSDYRRTEASLDKKIKKLSAKQNTVSGEEKTLLIVKKIAMRKEMTELAVEALNACVYAKAKFKTLTYKRVTVSHINAYNAACDEYEMHTGRPLVRLSPDMANEIIAGKICAPIPNVYYHGSEAFGVQDGISVSIDEERSQRLADEASLEEAEFHRLLSDDYPQQLTRDEIRERDKKQAQRMSAIKQAAERDLLLIGLRQDYRLARLESEYDLLVHSFSANKKKKEKRLDYLEQRISRARSELKRAVKIERDDNSRYYMLLAMDPETEKIKKKASRERLDALKIRLEVLLSEREAINERLIAVYGGEDKRLTNAKINRKAGAVRKKHAKATHRKQRKIANKIDRIKAPLDMKEKAYALLNKKTAAVATIEESYYKLRRLKPKGRAKRELRSNIRRARATIRIADADVKFLIRKMKRHEQKHEEDRRWTALLIFIIFAVIAGAILWYLYGDNVLAYFNDLLSKLGIR